MLIDVSLREDPNETGLAVRGSETQIRISGLLVRTLDRLIMIHRVLGGVLDLSQAEIVLDTLDSFKGVCAGEGPKAHQAYAAACSAKTVAGLRLELLRLPEDASPIVPTMINQVETPAAGRA